MTLGSGEIRAALDRILASDSFKRSGRLSRFLNFVVDNALEDRPERLKEYVLGVEVYQKGANFDPRIDSTVRVEAARLRAKLREYYETEGREDPIRIELPKGAYVPVFRPVSHAVPRRRAGLVWIAGLILVAGTVIFQLRPVKQPAATLVKPLTTWPGRELQPYFSPDGQQVAIVWSGEKDDNFDIYVKPVGDGPPRRLTRDPAPDRSPAWSPDGRFIAFSRNSATGTEVYLVPAQGGAERLVAKLRCTEAPTEMRFLDWFPDSEALVVADRNSGEESWSLFQLSVDTGEKRRLTSPPLNTHGDLQPAMSPDGRTLAFTRSLSQPLWDIYIAPAGGGEPRRLTFENQVIVGIAWGEDGRSIVFSSERGGTAGAGSLWRIPAAASTAPARPEQVPGVGPRARVPAIARRGRLLAYQEQFQDTNLWRAPASGEGVPELLVASTREEVRPDYSPDGSRIAFTSNRSGHWEIWTANADGSEARQVTSFAGTPASDPRWSPDGRRIAFHYSTQGNVDIYTMTPEGKSIRRLTSDSARDESPAWSKDGRWLYFSSNRTGAFEIWRMAVDDPARVTQLTRGGGSWPRESPDGRYVYFRRGPTGAFEVWRIPAGGGQPARVLGPNLLASWLPDQSGICFVEPGRIAHYDFATRRTATVVPLEKDAMVNGLALSPDRRWLLYGRRDRIGSDIMLVEHFQ